MMVRQLGGGQFAKSIQIQKYKFNAKLIYKIGFVNIYGYKAKFVWVNHQKKSRCGMFYHKLTYIPTGL